MKYKQYLHSIFDGCQRICAAAEIDLTVPGDPLANLTLMYCKQANVHFATDENAVADPDDLPAFSAPSPIKGGNGQDYEQHYIHAQYYVAALGVESSDRRLLDVCYQDGHIVFHIGIFNDDDDDGEDAGQQYYYVTVSLDHLQKGMKAVVTMEPLTDVHDDELGGKIGTPDTYEIRNLAERDEPMKIVVNELRDGQWYRTRELGEDEKGKFEIITEP